MVIGITAVVPSSGRPSLEATLESCRGADQVVVIGDPDNLTVQALARGFGYRYYASHPSEAQGHCGHIARNMGLGLVTTSHVATIDDDDAYLPGAFEAMRTAIAEHPRSPLFFRMVGGDGSHFPGVTVWNDKRLAIGQVGTPMIVAPTGRARFGTRSADDYGREFGDGYFGDFEYGVALVGEFGEPVWLEPLIAVIRPTAVESAA